MQCVPIFALANNASWPFLILAVCVAAIILLITKLRVHPFLALIGVAILAGLLTTPGTLPGEPEKSHWVQAVEVTATGLGEVAGKIGIVIALASIIGVCIMESGAADKVVRRFVAVFGEKRAGLALLVSGFLLGLPIFFDTLFMLLIPLARALRLRLGKDYTLFVLAICCAGAVTHSLVAPHPGPLAMAEALKVDLGWSVIVGTLVSIPPVFFGWQITKWLNCRNEIPLRETSGVSIAELQTITNKPESELPSFFASILPVLLPIILVSTASLLAAFGFKPKLGAAYTFLEFVGNRNIALLIGALLAMVLVVRQPGRKVGLATLLGPALETAGVIILITSAGGAFGLMLRHGGVGEAIRIAATGREINLILLAWGVALIMKFAQGSATVSMLTTAAMMVGVTQGTELPFHPMYLFIAIGFGALGFSWMNDSGFWVITKMSGMTEQEGLKYITPMTGFMGVVGLAVTIVGMMLFPLV